MRNHLAFRLCLAFSSLLLSVLTAAPVLATAQDQSCRKNPNFLLFSTYYQSAMHSSKGPACKLLKKVIEAVQDPPECTSFAIRKKRDAEDFQAIVTMEVSGNNWLFNQAKGRAALFLNYDRIEVEDAQIHVNISDFTDPKSFEDYCAGKTQTNSASSDEKGKDYSSPVEAEFVTRDEIDLSDFMREFGVKYLKAPPEQKEISDFNFAKNVIIEVQRAIGTGDDGIWGTGSRKALFKWVDSDENHTSPEATKTRINLLMDDSKSIISSDLLTLFSKTWSGTKSSLSQTTIVIAKNVPEAEQLSETKEKTGKRDLTENSLPKTIDALEQENNILKNDHASFSKQIQRLKNENQQLSEIVEEINSKFNKSQTEKVALQNKIDNLFTTPIFQNLDITGVIGEKRVEIFPEQINFSGCWNTNKSINENFHFISSTKDCLKYDDGTHEVMSDGHIYDQKSTRLELKLQKSFSDVISSVSVELGDSIPEKYVDYCGINMTLNANNESSTIQMRPVAGALRAEISELDALQADFKAWHNISLTFSSIKDEYIECELINPNEEIRIAKDFGRNSAEIDRDGNVLIKSELVRLKLRSKALTILLSTNLGAPVETSGADKLDLDYAFAQNPQRQSIYFSAFIDALEPLLNDQNSKYSKVQIFVANETGYELAYDGRFEDVSARDILNSVLETDPLQAYYINPAPQLKSLKDKGEDIGKVITFGSQGTPDNEYCKTLKKWTKYLQKDSPFIDINIVPFERFRSDVKLEKLTPEFLQCRDVRQKFVLLEQGKYDDGGDTSTLNDGLKNAMLKLMQD